MAKDPRLPSKASCPLLKLHARFKGDTSGFAINLSKFSTGHYSTFHVTLDGNQSSLLISLKMDMDTNKTPDLPYILFNKVSLMERSDISNEFQLF